MFGIVGYGNIGLQFLMLVEVMGMCVIYYDCIDKLCYGNIELVEWLDELLVQSDVVSLYVLEMLEMVGMIGEKELCVMKFGLFLINNSCGIVVDFDVFVGVLCDGYFVGVVVDVFFVELFFNLDCFKSFLQGFENVIFILYIGGLIEEVQECIGGEVV